ncbi:hypothetical protein LJR290_007592 [Variovorax sp. LjRoot290]|uniref:hypothetical protein n=1 Tax=Variovorax sp. LjRoot290 TaxID=3342316 RepID=UPI003ECCDA1D
MSASTLLAPIGFFATVALAGAGAFVQAVMALPVVPAPTLNLPAQNVASATDFAPSFFSTSTLERQPK